MRDSHQSERAAVLPLPSFHNSPPSFVSRLNQFLNLVTQIAQFSVSSGSNAGSVPRKEFLFKILVIGELGAGKTSLIKRYVHQIFSDHYRATIGVDFALKVFQWNDEEGTVIRLQLWDIAGQGMTICSFYYYHFSSPLTLSIAI